MFTTCERHFKESKTAPRVKKPPSDPENTTTSTEPIYFPIFGQANAAYSQAMTQLNAFISSATTSKTSTSVQKHSDLPS